MSRPNKFGIAPPTITMPTARDRRPGPMGMAVREAAESLGEATEAKVEQRRRNAEDARALREAEAEGRLLVTLPLAEIATDDLPRDRLALDAAASSDEMDELKASLRTRGQREPVEVYRDAAGRVQLKTGWRRLTALRQLHAETGEARFATVTARLEQGAPARLDRYVDMVEENVVRQDLTFAEMAQLAISAAADPAIEGDDPDALVARLYGSLHKMKRSYIRSFVFLLVELRDALRWPRAMSRNAGVEVARALRADPGRAEALRGRLRVCADEGAQAEVLAAFVAAPKEPTVRPASDPREKLTFRVGGLRVTARAGECRIAGRDDLLALPRERLERAVRAFEAALAEPKDR